MPFKKNDVNINRAGRPTGTKNNSEMKAVFKQVIETNLPNVDLWLNELAKDNPAKALELLLKLSEFILPKMRATEIDVSTKEPEPMTPEDREQRISELKKKLYAV